MGLIAKVEKKKRETVPEQSDTLTSSPVVLSSMENPKVGLESDGRISSITPSFDEPSQRLRDAEVKEVLDSFHESIGEGAEHEHFARVPTGIQGLDEVMDGGLRKGTVNLVGGGAGCGKSIFSMQFLVEGIQQFHEPGMYISFEENQEKIIQDFRSFGWDLKRFVEDKKLVILYYTPEQVERFLESGGGMVRDLIETLGVKRIVLDSLTAFTLLFVSELDKTKGILKLFDSVHSWGVTALMTAEQEPNPTAHRSTVIEFQVDGVILLYNVRKGDVRERSLEIFKMRATKHSAKIFPMQITDIGVTIYPEEPVF